MPEAGAHTGHARFFHLHDARAGGIRQNIEWGFDRLHQFLDRFQVVYSRREQAIRARFAIGAQPPRTVRSKRVASGPMDIK